MKLMELLSECRNGTNIIIEQLVYNEKGGDINKVFEGTVGLFGKTGYEQEDIAYIGARDKAILIVISKVQ